MIVELGAEIIFAVQDRVADTARWHVPAPTRRVRNGGRGKGHRQIAFVDQVAPLEWVALCGLKGWVYAYGLHAARGRCCAVCLERSPAKLLALPAPKLADVEVASCAGCGMPLLDCTPGCAQCWDRRRRHRDRERMAA